MINQLLWIDDDNSFLDLVTDELTDTCEVLRANSITEGIRRLKNSTVELVMVDCELGTESGLDAIRLVKNEQPSCDIVMVSGKKGTAHIVQAVKAGATDYMSKPITRDDLLAMLEKIQEIRTIRDRHDALVANLNPPSTSQRFVGVSPTFQKMIQQINRVKGHNANVLIHGESGTGKELLARHIHTLEKDAKRPFIAVNCAAIPDGLIESELFGHEKGAFTGASQRRLGKFELADGGDLFLDEICALRLDLQAKILRALQEKEVVRVGGNTPVRVNFRVIAATNEPLEEMVSHGRFRMDLYHRLRVIHVRVPALRERREDIPLLIAHFLEKYGKVSGPKRITAEALRRLQQHNWPGNVRELENAIQSLVILSPNTIIDIDHLPEPADPRTSQQQRLHHTLPNIQWGNPDSIPQLRDYLHAAEKSYIDHVLQVHQGDKSATALTLSIGRTTLYSKLKELGLM